LSDSEVTGTEVAVKLAELFVAGILILLGTVTMPQFD
jgi:hypothetical protein